MSQRGDLRISTPPLPPKAEYSMSSFGQPSDNRSSGRYILRVGSGADYWKPAWQGKETIVRILPAVFEHEGQKHFAPYRYSTNYLDVCDWIRSYPAVRSFGATNGITMILNNTATNPHYDVMTNPCAVLYNAISRACRQQQGKPEWFPLLQGQTGRSAALSKPTNIALVQAAVYTHSDKPMFAPGHTFPRGLGPHDQLVVFEIPPSSYKKLIQLWEERKPGYDGDPNDWESQYVHGDPVAIEGGRLIHFFEKECDPRRRFGAYQPAASGPAFPPAEVAAGASQSTSGDFSPRGYDVFMTKRYPGYPDDERGFPAALTGLEEVVKHRWKPWDQLLHFYTEEEQAHIISRLFPVSAIMYAFRDHPNWIPEDVEAASVGRTSAPGGYDPEPTMPSPSFVGTGTNPWPAGAGLRQTFSTPVAYTSASAQPITEPAPKKAFIPVRPNALGAGASESTLPAPPGIVPEQHTTLAQQSVSVDMSVPAGSIPDEPQSAPVTTKKHASATSALAALANKKKK